MNIKDFNTINHVFNCYLIDAKTEYMKTKDSRLQYMINEVAKTQQRIRNYVEGGILGGDSISSC